MAAINPYLSFSGTCEEAFEFYRSAFGGEFTMIHRFDDPGMNSGMPVPENEQSWIMHVSLPIGGTVLMGSDVPSGMGDVVIGTNYSISVGTDSENEAKRIFAALSSGGTVTMPLDKTFWGALFGMFKDKYGINWMVNYDYPRED